MTSNNDITLAGRYNPTTKQFELIADSYNDNKAVPGYNADMGDLVARISGYVFKGVGQFIDTAHEVAGTLSPANKFATSGGIAFANVAYDVFSNVYQETKQHPDDTDLQAWLVAGTQTAAGQILETAAVAGLAALGTTAIGRAGIALESSGAVVAAGFGKFTLGVATNEVYEKKLFEDSTKSAKDIVGDWVREASSPNRVYNPDITQLSLQDGFGNVADYSAYNKASLSSSLASLGMNDFNLGDGNWASLGSANAAFDSKTFNLDGESYTLFGEGDYLTIPSMPMLDFGSLSDFYKPNNLITSALNDFLTSQNRISPLVLDLNKNGIESTSLYSTNVFFDIDGDGYAQKVGWVKPTEGLLSIDTNNNGVIDDITELFGDDKQPAFDKLRGFDSNHDGKINSTDKDYAKLLVWNDLDQDGYSDAGELKNLQTAGVKEISLAETKDDIYQNDNYISSHASFTTFDNSTAQIADVHFMNDNTNTSFMGAQSQVYGSTYAVDPETLLLPLSRGYGSLASLHIAMTNNPELKTLMQEMVNLSPTQFNQFGDKMTAFMYEWAGVTDNSPTSRQTGDGNNIDSRMVDFIEKFTGVEWAQMGVSSSVGEKAALIVKQVWGDIQEFIGSRILMQGTLADIFQNAHYDFKTDSMIVGDSMNTLIANAKTYAAAHGLSGDNAHEFWLDMGNILIGQKEELHTSVSAISTALDVAYGERLFIGEATLTQADGDIYSMKADKDGHYADQHIIHSVYTGTSANDTITGSNHNDYMFGKEGNNTLNGQAGDDFLRGGAGTDSLQGGTGDDRLEGGAGDDSLDGGVGRDDIHGGEGKDTLQGGDGDDRLEGDAGADLIDGGAGNNGIAYLDSTAGVYVNLATSKTFGGYAEGDSFTRISNIDASDHDDVLIGDAGNNTINGERGDDYIRAGAGNDYLFGATGSNQLYGEEGNDIFSGFEGAETMDGGTGTDRVIYTHPYNKGGVYINLETGEGDWNAAEGDKYTNIENATATNETDVLIGNAGNNYLRALGGNDVVNGGAGNDTLESGTGDDWLIGGTGKDRFVVTPSSYSTVSVKDFNPLDDVLDYSEFTSDITKTTEISLIKNGNDTVVAIDAKYLVILKGISPSQLQPSHFITQNTSLATLRTYDSYDVAVTQTGDNYDNWLTGTIGADRINGAGGSDTIMGYDGNDTLEGGTGTNVFVGGNGADSMIGGSGSDMLDYEDSYEAITLNLATSSVSGGTATGDTFSGIEHVFGSVFNDVITGNSSANLLRGNAGNDTLKGGGGNDELSGEDGSDLFVITANPNTTSTIKDFELSNLNEKIDLTAFGNLSSLQINGKSGVSNVSVMLPENQYVNLEGVSMNDMLKLTASHFTLSSANTVITLQMQNDTGVANMITGTAGANTINTLGNTNYVIDGKGNDTITGSYLTLKGTVVSQTGYDFFQVTKDANAVDTIINFDTVLLQQYRYKLSETTMPVDEAHRVKDYNGSKADTGIIDLTAFADIRTIADIGISTTTKETTLTLTDNQKIILDNYTPYKQIMNILTDSTGRTANVLAFDQALTSSNFIFYSGTMEGDKYGLVQNDSLQGGKGVDTLKGLAGNDTLLGGAESDSLDGGTGSDILDGGMGNDTLFGGDGIDSYIIGKEAAAIDTISNFEFWQIGEKIDLSAFNSQYKDFAALKSSISQNGADTVINLGSSQKIILQNVGSEYITADNFSGNVGTGGGGSVGPVLTATNLNQMVTYTEDQPIGFAPIAVSSTATTAMMTITISNKAAGALNTGTQGSATSTFTNGVWSASGNIADINSLLSTLKFTPSANYNGSFTLSSHVTSSTASPVDGTITLTGIAVNDAPVSTGTTIAISGQEDVALKITPLTVNDIEDGAIALNAANVAFTNIRAGAAVSVNADGTFSYTGGANFNGADSFSYTVKDSNGLATSPVTVNLNLAAVNDAPVAGTALTAQSIASGTNFTFAVPATAFTDADGDVLTYSAKLSTGAALPSWLGFNATTRTFSGTPTASNAGTQNIMLTASDGKVSASNSFGLTVTAANTAPVNAGSVITATGQEDGLLKITPLKVTDTQDGVIALSATNVAFTNIRAGATVAVNTDGTFSYTGAANFNGADSFSYTVKDSKGLATSPVTVNLNLTAVNDAPVIGEIIAAQTASVGKIFNFAVPTTAFTDADSNTLTYSAKLQTGAALPSWLGFNAATRTFSGTAPSGASSVVVALTASDGSLTATQNFTLTINAATGNVIVGTSGRNTLNGTAYSDTISGAGGYDTINGQGGNDSIDGGDGYDTITAGSGNDSIYGGTDGGYDSINGGEGNNSIDGGNGNDIIIAGGGNDNIIGGAGADTINAGGGKNTIDGGDGYDIITTSAGDDSIYGGIGNGYDSISAGEGNNTIDGGDGYDTITAGAGNDSIYGGIGNGYDSINGGDGNNTIDGGDGNDIIIAGGGNDNIIGGAGADTINVGDGKNTIDGGDGRDNITTSAGDDSIYGGIGNGYDSINAGEGNNTIDGGDGYDTITAGAGDDSIYGGIGNGYDSINGGDGNNTIGGGDGNDTITAGAGSDSIKGGTGNDNINAGAGNDTIDGSTGRDIIQGGEGIDTIDYRAATSAINVTLPSGVASSSDKINNVLYSIENVIGSNNNDTITGSAGSNAITAGTGVDRLTGNGGADIFIYTNLTDSQNGAYDTITDFSAVAGTEMDKIDLSDLAIFTKNTPGINHFSELTIVKDTARNETIITIVDAAHPGSTAYFELHISGIVTLTATNFIWD